MKMPWPFASVIISVQTYHNLTSWLKNKLSIRKISYFDRLCIHMLGIGVIIYKFLFELERFWFGPFLKIMFRIQQNLTIFCAYPTSHTNFAESTRYPLSVTSPQMHKIFINVCAKFGYNWRIILLCNRWNHTAIETISL